VIARWALQEGRTEFYPVALGPGQGFPAKGKSPTKLICSGFQAGGKRPAVEVEGSAEELLLKKGARKAQAHPPGAGLVEGYDGIIPG